MQRIAITGSSCYYGRKLVEHIRRESPETLLLGIDVIPPRDAAPHEFFQADVRSPDVRTALANFQPDTIVHLAFVVNPIRDTRLMHDINVNGTKNVFDAVRAIRPKRFLMASSATAYGAWPDNPVPITEDWSIRACTEFQYSADKSALEAEIKLLHDELPNVAVSWTRPVIIGGKGVSNYLSRYVLNLPFMVLPNGRDVPLHFVREEDCVAATWAILQGNARGPFNVGPPRLPAADENRQADESPLNRVAVLVYEVGDHNLVGAPPANLRLPAKSPPLRPLPVGRLVRTLAERTGLPIPLHLRRDAARDVGRTPAEEMN